MFLCANDGGQVGTSNDVHDLLRLSMNGESNHEVGDGTWHAINLTTAVQILTVDPAFQDSHGKGEHR